uniref:Uncharacterized protein n=1 Tax=uncultured marine microorganism HF4000_008B14 TaxID=455512 RepID=B3T112_9ZZZZ|nr:hypothetical protein ALOHA_HF4000008B14ctg1g10 [uncultured marine microorganism HF4000_008B14]
MSRMAESSQIWPWPSTAKSRAWACWKKSEKIARFTSYRPSAAAPTKRPQLEGNNPTIPAPSKM